MNQQPGHETISFLLVQICKAQRNVANETLTEIGLFAGQELFLGQLWQQDGLTQSQLVKQMCVQPPTVSKMLDRMERSGLVSRRADPQDSRISRVYLTEQGRNLQQGVGTMWNNLEKQIVEGLSVEERILLRRLLLQLHENLMRHP